MAYFGESRRNSSSYNSACYTNFFMCPQSIQFEIFSLMDIVDHMQIRTSNEKLKKVNDQYWTSELKKAICKAESSLKTTDDTLLLALKRSTQIYIENGYESTFFDCLLPFLGDGPSSLYNITECKLESFLMDFYSIVDKQIGYNNSKHSRSLYALTLLHQLKCFSPQLMNIERNSLGLSVYIQIKNIWLGAICELVSRQKLSFLPVAIAKLLSAHYLKKTSAFVDINDEYRFIYGYECTERKRSPRTNFEIFIDGSKELINNLYTWITSPLECLEFPKKLLMEGFGFIFRVQVKSYVKYGWPQIIYMDLENYAETGNDDED